MDLYVILLSVALSVIPLLLLFVVSFGFSHPCSELDPSVDPRSY